ncbi:MAG TPA: hypothetical protein VJ826_03885 [Candidatus Polarisedimenticolaceae bacterium]|nr:hypothetical protein [Candidatus Polarisedimenticolaceae bacterium]
MSSTSRAAVLAMSLGLAALASANTPTVEVAVVAHKEVVTVDAHGKQAVTLVPATEGKAGDTIVYTLRAKNAGTGTAVDPRIEDPIPAGTVLVVDSVKHDGYRIEASLDGGSTWQAFPAQVTRKNASGAIETVAAPAESYTTLRWVLNGPLQPGDGKDVSFKVRIR